VLERRITEPEAQGIAAFYETRAGLAARRAILAKLHHAWPSLKGLRLLGYGFAMPYLAGINAERCIIAIPATSATAADTLVTPGGKSNLVLCEEDALPFVDSLFDRILIVHGLERAEVLRPLLRQMWRVLAPEGKLLVIAPNRASLWAQVETTPFGQGRPFSRSELDRLLRESLFVPERWDRALYAPPLGTRLLLRTGRNWERAGARFFPALGGVHIVEARKTIYAPTPIVVAETKPALLSPDFSSPA
jgi:SAM-dependent methyltransferase